MIGNNKSQLVKNMKVVHDKLLLENIDVSKEQLEEITRDIMNISYSKGGDYSCEMVGLFADGYIQKGLFQKILK